MKTAVTRPQADGERTATTLRARGHDVLVTPLMRVEPVTADLAGGWAGVIITSANAPGAIASHAARAALSKLPAYAVGWRSAEAARQAGFRDVSSVGGDVHDLLRLIAERHSKTAGPLLYLAGEDRAADLAAELAARGIAADMRVVYRAVTAPFPPPLTAALKAGGLDAVLHFSKRSAENYLAGAGPAGVAAQALAVGHFCLSPQIAAPLKSAGAVNVMIAARPDEAALIDLVG